MLFTTKALLATSLVSLSAIAQAGKAHIYNTCDFDVYLWSISADQTSECHTLSSGSGSYSEDYYTASTGGVSLKLSKKESISPGDPITQLEYTLNDMLWYDTSNVDCTTTECPFQEGGMYMQSGEGCPTMSCSAGALTCSGAYTASDDNWASLSCDKSADLSLFLCTSSNPNSTETSYGKRSERIHARHPHWRH